MASTPAPTTPAAPAPASVPTVVPPGAAAGSPAGFHLPSYLLGLITALILSGAALFFWPRPQPPAVQLQAPPMPAAGPTVGAASASPTAPAAPTPSPLMVFVSGAVAQPGLYTLAPGARVGDALVAAGGLLPQVDMALINQAQPLVDGAQLHIPAPTATPMPALAAGPIDSQADSQDGVEAAAPADAAATTPAPTPAAQPPAPAALHEPAAGLSVPLALPTPTLAQASSGGSTEGSTDGSTARAATVNLSASGALINVNTATGAELESLPAIGPAKAQAIIANRPYATVDDLDRVPGIGPATLEQIRPLVTTE